jgi:putative endonuclease
MKTARQRLASWGENLAAEYLVERGYQIIGRNVRSSYGEIDLIARHASLDGGNPHDAAPLTLFVEVKARSSIAFGYPEQAITAAKKAHLLASVQEYIRLHPEIEGEWRIDVIAILRSSLQSPPEIRVFENAVTAE